MTPSDTLFDTHAHFFTDDIERYPIDTAGAREGAAALRQRILSEPATPQRLLPMWDAQGVVGGAAVQYSSAYKTDNRYVLDCAAAHPARVAPVVILDAAAPDTPGRLREMVQASGVVALRLSGRVGPDGSCPWLDGEATRPTWDEAQRLGIAMVLMYLPTQCHAPTLARLAARARQFPQLPIVVDHIGWPELRGAPDFGLGPVHEALGALPNVSFKITSVNLDELDAAGLPTDAFVRHAVTLLGAHRLMWGSDFGNTLGSLQQMVERMRAACALLTPAERTALLHDNGRALFAPRGT